MRLVAALSMVLVAALVLTMGVFVLIGQAQAPSERVERLHLTDCDLPCWNNVTPRVSAIRDVAARIDDTFPHFQHLSSSSLPFQTWQRVDRAAGGTSINIAVDDGRAFSVGIKTDDADQTMPSLGEMLVIFGSPTCVIRDEASASLTWGYENRSHQTILQFTVSQPSLWKPISSMLVGVSNLPICQKLLAKSWIDFRNSQFLPS